MTQLNNITTLSQSKDAHIYLCHCCHQIHFTYKNVMLSLEPDEWEFFLKSLKSLNNSHFDLPHPTGNVVAFHFEKFNNGYFCFNQQEWSGLRELTDKAELILSVYKKLDLPN